MGSPLSQETSLDPLRLLVREGIVPTPICTLVFLLLYFSSLAAALWWALTTASWAGMVLCSLEPKVLENKSPLLHTLGWGVPALLTITALVMHQVEGDELTGFASSEPRPTPPSSTSWSSPTASSSPPQSSSLSPASSAALCLHLMILGSLWSDYRFSLSSTLPPRHVSWEALCTR